LATALAIYAAYFGYETYQAFQDKPGRYGWVVLDFLGMAPWNWLGLGAAVVVGGGAEYLSARLLRR
jgi:hypothetical protein